MTARLNLDRFIAGWPYEPEDLDDGNGPHLAVATLDRFAARAGRRARAGPLLRQAGRVPAPATAGGSITECRVRRYVFSETDERWRARGRRAASRAGPRRG